MRKDLDKIILENRMEVSLLQNVIEIAIQSGDCNDDEKEVAKETAKLLDAMYYTW